MNEDMRYRQVMRFASETVWAVLPSTLWTIRELLSMRVAGVKLEQAEIEARIVNGRAKPDASSNGGVAVVPLWGVLVPHAGMMVDVSTPGTGLDAWAEQFRQAIADPNVDTVVLQVNSPGGSAQGVTETAKIVRDARSQKRIVAVADTLAASAAFAIATQADEFYSTPSGMVGAVHAYSIHEDISAALDAEGVKPTLIGAPDEGAAEAMPFLPLSDENRAHIQRVVDQFYATFVGDVAKGRGVDASTVETSFGRGRVLTSKDALSAGMIDGVASFEQVVARLAAGKPVTGGTRSAAELAPVETIGAAVPYTSVTLPGADLIAQIHGFGAITDATDNTSTTALAAHAAQVPAPVRGGNPTTGGHNMEATSLDRPLTLEELAAQDTQLENEMNDLVSQAAGRAFNEDEQARFDDLEGQRLEIANTIKNIQDREARMKKLAGNPNNRVSGVGIDQAGSFYTNADRKGPMDIFDLAAYRSHARSLDDLVPLWHDGAKRANELAAYRTRHVAETRAFVEALIDKDNGQRPSDSFAHRMLITANPMYDAAFGRWVMGRESNADHNMIRMAVSNTGLGSETPVPVTIDPTVLYSGDGARSPLRAISQVITITGLKWRGLSSDGISMSYGAESSTFTPATPTFDAPDVQVEKAKGEIQFTVEVDDDWPNLRSELQRLFNIAKANLEADKFLHGTGTNEPSGLVYALDADGTSRIDTATANTIAWSDITGLSDDLPSSFDTDASWLAHKAFFTLAESLAVAQGYLNGWVGPSAGFQAMNGSIGRLHGSPAYPASGMSKLFTTGSEEVAVVGDFQQGFVIIDRVGLNVELDPHPRDSNGAWTGARALVCWFRNNTHVRTVNAFRLLRVKHT